MNTNEPTRQTTFGELLFFAVVSTLAYFWYVDGSVVAQYIFFGYIYVLTFIYIIFISMLLTVKSELEKRIVEPIKLQKSNAKLYFVFMVNTIWAILLIDTGNIITAATFYLTYIFCAITTAKMKEKASHATQ